MLGCLFRKTYKVSDTVIGKGAYGKVYVATKEKKTFAVKKITIPLNMEDARRVLREIQIQILAVQRKASSYLV
jgi:serine/threonine protein kinase